MNDQVNSAAAADNAAKAMQLNDAGFAASTIEISKKNAATNKHEKVGEVSIFVPPLKLFGLDAAIKSIGDDGLPVYDDDKADWLFNAVVAAVKAKARNSLVSGTANLKPDTTIAADFEALLAEGTRGGEALAVVRDLKKQLDVWLATESKKSAAAQDKIRVYFQSRQGLSVQSMDTKERMVGYITQFSEWLAEKDVALLEKGSKYLNSLLEVCEAEDGATDF